MSHPTEVPTWCNDDAVAENKTTFINYWKPKLEQIVGPEDALVFVRELDDLIGRANSNTRHKAEAKAWLLRRQVKKAFEDFDRILGFHNEINEF